MNLPLRKPARSATWLMLLGAMTGLGPISIDLYLPAFSLMKQDLGTGIENTLASYLFGVAIGQLVYGPVSDHFGRKPPLYVALTLYCFASLGCALAGNMEGLVLWRFIQALGGCAGMVIARAVVRDSCEAHEAARVFSTLIMITAVGPIIAPLLGSYITTLGNWHVVFYVQAGFGVGLLVAMHWLLEETHDPKHTHALKISTALRSYLLLLRDRDFVCYSLIGAFAIATIFCYISSAPTVLMVSYGLSPQQLALLMGAGGLSFVVASQFNLRRLRTRSPAQVLKVAVWMPVLFSLGLVLVNFYEATGLWVLIALQLAIFMAIAHIGPNVSAQALAPQGARAGAASALLGSIQSIGSTLAGAATGLFNNGSVRSMALLMFAGAVGMLLSHRLLLLTGSKQAAG